MGKVGTQQQPQTTTPPSNIRGELRDWYRVVQGEGLHFHGVMAFDKEHKWPIGKKYYTGRVIAEDIIDKPEEDWIIIEDIVGNRWLLWRNKERKFQP